MKRLSIKDARNLRRRNRSKRNNLLHPERPRLVVYRSNKHITAQIIDDHKGETLVSASSYDKLINKEVSKAKSKIDISSKVGTVIAKKAIEKGLKRKPWVKTSLGPGSRVVSDYLKASLLDEFLGSRLPDS